MKNYFFIFSFIFLFISIHDSFSQRIRREKAIQQTNQTLFSEVYQIPSNDSGILYYIYKIPYYKLVFEKDNDQYKAAYRFTIEVVDSNKQFVVRQITEKNIIADNFDETISRSTYSAGVFKLNLSKANYFITPIISDKNSEREGKFKQIPIYSEDFKNNTFLEPIVINETKTDCNNSKEYFIPNFDGEVPFDKNKYDLLIPTSDSSLSNIFVSIYNNRDTVFNEEVSKSFYAKLGFKECKNNVLFNDDQTDKYFKYFVINNFNKDLIEGKLRINVSKTKDSKSKQKFVKAVNWFNKPMSLIDPEFAIKSLKYMEGSKVIDSLLDLDEKNYRTALFDYWKKYDPTPETSFNELMDEYYSRVDYAAKNFTSISGRQGFNSDRGKIFIRFGKPNKIKRDSNTLGQIVETWIYENPLRKFIFVDSRGTGEYQLTNG